MSGIRDGVPYVAPEGIHDEPAPSDDPQLKSVAIGDSWPVRALHDLQSGIAKVEGFLPF